MYPDGVYGVYLESGLLDHLFSLFHGATESFPASVGSNVLLYSSHLALLVKL
jgi:hypothetical protein